MATVTTPAAMVTVIPDDLKKLARLVVRGFYSREDVLIIDMLVRHHCMREDDVSTLLKFDKKLVRAKMSVLKRDKLVQVIPS
jgi:transcription initiation factor TFIIE subunit alpha